MLAPSELSTRASALGSLSSKPTWYSFVCLILCALLNLTWYTSDLTPNFHKCGITSHFTHAQKVLLGGRSNQQICKDSGIIRDDKRMHSFIGPCPTPDNFASVRILYIVSEVSFLYVVSHLVCTHNTAHFNQIRCIKSHVQQTTFLPQSFLFLQILRYNGFGIKVIRICILPSALLFETWQSTKYKSFENTFFQHFRGSIDDGFASTDFDSKRMFARCSVGDFRKFRICFEERCPIVIFILIRYFQITHMTHTKSLLQRRSHAHL